MSLAKLTLAVVEVHLSSLSTADEDPMSKKLIITEKPSVAADVARALGGFVRNDDYYESDEYILASAIGHLLELACPKSMKSNAASGLLPIYR
jgi:hypothetical protein